MKKHIQESREFLARRGHMVAFLMVALAITTWINNFQDMVAPAVIDTFF